MALYVLPASMANANGVSSYAVARTPGGPILQFESAENAIGTGSALPEQGWFAGTTDHLWSPLPVDYNKGSRTGWARIRFDRAALGAEPLALFTQDNRDRLSIFLNGREVFRNYASDRDNVLAWNRPYLVPVPTGALHPGINEIVVRVSADYAVNLSTGTLKIGPHRELLREYDRQYFWRISAPQAANYAMLVLIFAALVMWLWRREEPELLLLALSGLLWFARDYHFFGDRVTIDFGWFRAVTLYSVYFATAASLGFYVLFLKLPHAWGLVKAMFGAGVAITLLRIFELRVSPNDNGVSMLVITMVLVVIVAIIRDWWGHRQRPHLAVLAVLLVTTVLSVHDIGRRPNTMWWTGLGFHIQPFIGVTLFTVSLLSIGSRFVSAISTIAVMNTQLELRIEQTRAELAASEAARRELEVDNAIETERSRLMREMHDGIGSNLVTALAIAQNHQESPRTIATLQRALSDLKITVDSLAPVDGDVVTLLASLRHRLEPDMAEAGLKCLWRVEDCPPLTWLDATNALHVLRIFQEAIGNTLAHSQANRLEIGCAPAEHEGHAGLKAWVADNGKGFAGTDMSGKGMANMRARAEAMHGSFDCQSAPGKGCRITVWFPLERGVTPSRPPASV